MAVVVADVSPRSSTPARTDRDRRRRSAAPFAASRNRWLRACAYLVVLALAALAAVGLHWTQNQTDDSVRQRFVARSVQSAGFVSTFTSEQLGRERAVAEQTLAQGDNPPLGQVVTAFGFKTGGLFDDKGSLLAIYPPAPALLGTPVGLHYAHLRTALAGTPAVSGVVPSAANSDPVIAFATPFATPSGRRVLSGAYLVTDTPLRQYLNGMSTLKGFRGFIIDREGNVVAASGPATHIIGTLSAQMPAVAASLRHGNQVTDRTGRYNVATPITGTPWRLVLSVPDSQLLVTAHSHSIEQVAGVGVLTLIGLLTCWLGLRLRDERRALHTANDRLGELAHVDGLTGLWNRRRLDELLVAEHERCRREKQPLSVLLVDIDHFKRVNDTFGHIAGDDVLRAVTDRIRGAIRAGDSVGRWGGEEFLVVLPLTGRDEAAIIAERLRLAVCVIALSVGTGGAQLTVTVSIGCSGDTTSESEVLVSLADRALYAAKSGGRNQVASASETEDVARDGRGALRTS